jgi:hypothetical protein
MNWGNKLDCCATNVGLVNYDSGCCSIVSHNGFFVVLIVFGVVVLLPLCGNGSCLSLILNKFVHK